MAKERLSKLQRWIISRCMEKGFVWRNEAREFYGKKFNCGAKIRTIMSSEVERVLGKEYSEFYDVKKVIRQWKSWKDSEFKPTEWTILTPKKEYVSTKAEEVSITKSFRNMERKGLIANDTKWDGVRRWELTEKGFLKANKWSPLPPFVSFKDYCIGVEKKKKEWLMKGGEKG